MNIEETKEAIKVCTKCGESKSLCEFSPRKTAKDGLRRECKGCTRAAHKKWRYANKGIVTAYSRNWRKSQKRGYWRPYANTQNQYAAHRSVFAAIKRGDMKREPCVDCGNSDSEAHHSDYHKPLDVTWLCREHHSQWHQENGKGENL